MKSKPWLKFTAIGAALLAAVCAVSALVVFVFIPAGKYNSAKAMREAGDLAGAYDQLDRLGDYRDAAALKDAIQAQVLESRSADTMEFAGLQWLVMEERDGKALLLLREALDPIAYNEALIDTSWESCTLRIHLNSSFYQSLPEADRDRIVQSTVLNSGNAENGTPAGEDTQDFIFLLSLAEAKLYFPAQSDRIARTAGGSTTAWWLRSPGLQQELAAMVLSDGTLGYAGSGVDYTTRAVRPALWLSLS